MLEETLVKIIKHDGLTIDIEERSTRSTRISRKSRRRGAVLGGGKGVMQVLIRTREWAGVSRGSVNAVVVFAAEDRRAVRTVYRAS